MELSSLTAIVVLAASLFRCAMIVCPEAKVITPTQATEFSPDTMLGVTVYPILEDGHSRQFINQYVYAYQMGNPHLSYRLQDEAETEFEIILGSFPDDYPDDRRYLLSDSSFLTLEAGFMPGDTIWFK